MTTYAELETSEDSGQPVEFYKFSYQGNDRHYCDYTEPVLRNGITFQPETLSRGGTQLTTDMNKMPLTITTHKNFEPALLFIQGIVHFPVSITILRGHFIDTTDQGGYTLIYKGRVTGAVFNDMEVELNCEPIFTSLKTPGVRKVYEPTCVHNLFDPSCKADANAHKIPTTVLGSLNGEGKNLTISSSHADDSLSGGYININGALYMIASNTGWEITLTRYVKLPGTTVPAMLYPGCNRSLTDCHNRYNNVANFGGFPWMPIRNPFSGDAPLIGAEPEEE